MTVTRSFAVQQLFCRVVIVSVLLTLASVATAGGDEQSQIERELASFKAEFVRKLESEPLLLRLRHLPERQRPEPVSPASLSDRIRDYINDCPPACYGATVTLLDEEGKAVASPYWYRSGGDLAYADLMAPDYGIDEQAWLRRPLESGEAVWSDPYFDQGGGEIWMRTYSFPIRVDGRIIAIATTDIAVAEPEATP